MIIEMTAEAALDVAERNRTMICFAKAENLLNVERFLSRYVNTHGFRLVRVEPSVESAKTLQLSRYPAFILYEDGCERFNVVGVDSLYSTLENTIR